MNNQVKKIALSFFILLTPYFIQSKVIFWDVEKTLVTINESKVLTNSLGKWNVFKSFIKHLITKRPLSSPIESFKLYTRGRYFEALKSIPYKSTTPYDIYSDDGITPLPDLLKDLMLGKVNHIQAKKICKQWLKNPKNNFFKAKEERAIFKGTFHYNFDPDCFCAYLEPMPQQIQLLQSCKDMFDEKGKKKNICIVLSNLATEAVKPFKKRFEKDITPCIDYWIFSCDGQGAKPYKSIYKHCYKVVKEHFPEQLNELWIFVDDQDANRKGFADYIKNCKKKRKPKLICTHPNQASFVLRQQSVIN